MAGWFKAATNDYWLSMNLLVTFSINQLITCCFIAILKSPQWHLQTVKLKDVSFTIKKDKKAANSYIQEAATSKWLDYKKWAIHCLLIDLLLQL